jgi:hypothetical protein
MKVRRLFASVFALLCAGGCASAASRDAPRLIFQTVKADGAPLVRLYSDESVIVSVAGEEVRFSNVVATFPRWNGTRYRGQSGGRGLFMEIRDDRPCSVEGVDHRRTATVRLSLSGADSDQTTCGYHMADEAE